MKKKLDKTQQSLFSEESLVQSPSRNLSQETILWRKPTGFCVQLPLSVTSSLRYLIFSKNTKWLVKESLNKMACATVLVQPTFAKEQYLGFVFYSKGVADLSELICDFLVEKSLWDHSVSNSVPFVRNVAILQREVRETVNYLYTNQFYPQHVKENEEIF